MSGLKKAGLLVAGLVLLAGVIYESGMLDRLIESQIFFPDRSLAATPAEFGLAFEDVFFRASDGVRLHAWWLPAPEAGPAILFCHGNAGNISHRLDNLARLIDSGISVFIFDYRGYGLSQGRISEAGLYLDAEAALEAASRRAGRPPVVFGRSLGGVAAIHLGAGREVPGLILESTFTHLGAMARRHFPLPGLEAGLAKRFNSLGRIGRVRAPILFFHGDRDDIVPLELGRELFQATLAPKEFVLLSGAGHNDTYLVGGQAYFDKFKFFLDGLAEAGR